MEYDEIVNEFLDEFPEYIPMYMEHIEINNEVLPHVFFGETLNEDLPKLIEESKDKEKLDAIFTFLERMATDGDQEVKNLLMVTILERLGDEPTLLRYAVFNYMGEKTKQASIIIERFWGRDFNIY